MAIGVLTAQLAIYGARSLKEKRRVVKGLKDRIRHKFNVSIAETDKLDFWQSATLSAAIVSNDLQFADRCLKKVISLIQECHGASLTDYRIEFF